MDDGMSAGWSPEHRDVWVRIASHPFEHEGIALDFARRLARTLGWSLDETRALIEEYRRFCFLACVTDVGAVTPSEEVDEAWHLHLAYTRDYWDRWCGEALGRRLHHDPTAGGPAEQARYRTQYAATLALYERWFGPPPAALWPGTAQRFAERPRFRMVDRRRGWLPPLRSWRSLGLGTTLAAASTPAHGEPAWPDWRVANPFDFDGPTFLILYLALIVLAVTVTWLLRDAARTLDRRPDMRDLDDIELAYLAGGSNRAADTLYLALASRGAATHDKDEVSVDARAAELPAHLQAFCSTLGGHHKRRPFLSKFATSAPYEAMLARLRRRKILLDVERRRRLVTVTMLPGALLFLFGLAKVGVGVGRGKPVGFLLMLMAMVAVQVLVTLGRERYLTREARASLAALRDSRSRALRAPLPEEVAFAFAMLGAVALDGTEHAGYAKLLRSPGDGGCSGGGGGCSGGGGGGGCGGCGA